MSTALSSNVFVVCLQIVSRRISIINRFTAVVVKNVIKIGFKILYIRKYVLHPKHTKDYRFWPSNLLTACDNWFNLL